ncbi:hypothetical protein [Staphylococcus simulans]|uniref:hypothetical protein n=1 Tax=Staphylococcus simulans TaxID=1286 RepID=UPI000D1E74BE|nr:hypothetical protein [Staphylococcus simulans]PTI87553.1 hypothetical protein BU053_04280 [Staphylococcus simulans]RIN50526.1 hypothetical protein BU041_07170 [Staphylococcus simulans]UXR52573.1 hypothetical protein MUA82_00140 [Staphylococcus simulans]
MLTKNTSILAEPVTSELIKLIEKKRITDVIAPEHNKRHHDHENKLKNEEEILVEQIINHCDKFRGDFEKAAKGDWVDSAISELEKIKDNLKSIMDY